MTFIVQLVDRKDDPDPVNDVRVMVWMDNVPYGGRGSTLKEALCAAVDVLDSQGAPRLRGKKERR